MPKRKHSSVAKTTASDTQTPAADVALESMDGGSAKVTAEESTSGGAGDEGGGAVFDVDITQYESQLTAKVGRVSCAEQRWELCRWVQENVVRRISLWLSMHCSLQQPTGSTAIESLAISSAVF